MLSELTPRTEADIAQQEPKDIPCPIPQPGHVQVCGQALYMQLGDGDEPVGALWLGELPSTVLLSTAPGTYTAEFVIHDGDKERAVGCDMTVITADNQLCEAAAVLKEE